jgi:hypothetical protein
MASDKPGSYRRALRSPLVVIMILAGILIAALGGSMVTQVLGVLAVVGGFVAASAVANSSGFQKAARDEAERNELVESKRNLTFRIEELDADARTRMKSILKCHTDIREEARSTGRDTVPEVANVLLQIDVMLDRGLSIARKRRELLADLRRINARDANSKLNELVASATSEQDPKRKAELQAAIDARTSELKDASAVEATCAKVLAELDGIESSFAVIRSNLVKLAGEDAESRIAAGKELSEMLASVGREAESDGSDASDRSDPLSS